MKSVKYIDLSCLKRTEFPNLVCTSLELLLEYKTLAFNRCNLKNIGLTNSHTTNYVNISVNVVSVKKRLNFIIDH